MELIENKAADAQKTTSYVQNEAYERAKRKVDNLKGFYTHLVVYVVVNTFITWQQVDEYIGNGKTLEQAFEDNGTYMLWALWGLGVVLHGLNVFITNGVFGQKWEERKIKEYMDDVENRTRK